MFRKVLSKVLRATGCKLYRNGLPRGTDLASDINRAFGVGSIKVIFDVGANIGQSCVSYAEEFPAARIHCFEPVKRSFDKLTENTRHLKMVTCHQFGMGDEVGTAGISIESTGTTNSILHGSGAITEKIQIDTIDHFAAAIGLPHVDLLKIDVEGYELKVLEGAKKFLTAHQVDFLYIESEPIESSRHFIPFARLASVLGQYGYELFAIYEQQIFWDGRQSVLFFNPTFISPRLLKGGLY